MSGLTDADNSSFLVSGGGNLTLSALVNYAGAVDTTGDMAGHGEPAACCRCQLPRSPRTRASYSSRTQIQALSGGDVELPKLTTITGGPVQLESDGAGSTLNINALTTIQGNTGQQYYSGVQATNHGTVSDAALATLKQAEPDARRHGHHFTRPDCHVHRRDSQPDRRHGDIERTDRRRQLELPGQRRRQADRLGAW